MNDQLSKILIICFSIILFLLVEPNETKIIYLKQSNNKYEEQEIRHFMYVYKS